MKQVIFFSILLFLLFDFQACNSKSSKESPRKIIEINESNEIWGIDISRHQKKIDWNKLNKEKPHFVFFKATEGLLIKDSTYLENKAEAEKRNLLVGAYHFLGYKTPAVNQAKEFIQFAQLKKGNLIPVLDVEQRRRMPKKAKILSEIRQFIKAIEMHYGVSPIIYTNVSYYKKYLENEGFEKYILWIADYKKEPVYKWKFWQHTEKHRISGINTSVDRNVFKGSKDELLSLVLKK